MSTGHLPEREFLALVDQLPLVSIDLILTRPDGSVLLGYRNNRPAQGFWFVPGGRIRKDERMAAALARIARAELGEAAPVSGWQQAGFWEHLYPDNFAGQAEISTHYLVLAHRLELDAALDLRLDDQHSAFKWWPLAELLASDAVHENTKAYFRGLSVVGYGCIGDRDRME